MKQEAPTSKQISVGGGSSHQNGNWLDLLSHEEDVYQWECDCEDYIRMHTFSAVSASKQGISRKTNRNMHIP